jgi:hypothetical protein
MSGQARAPEEVTCSVYFQYPPPSHLHFITRMEPQPVDAHRATLCTLSVSTPRAHRHTNERYGAAQEREEAARIKP